MVASQARAGRALKVNNSILLAQKAARGADRQPEPVKRSHAAASSEPRTAGRSQLSAMFASAMGSSKEMAKVLIVDCGLWTVDCGIGLCFGSSATLIWPAAGHRWPHYAGGGRRFTPFT